MISFSLVLLIDWRLILFSLIQDRAVQSSACLSHGVCLIFTPLLSPCWSHFVPHGQEFVQHPESEHGSSLGVYSGFLGDGGVSMEVVWCCFMLSDYINILTEFLSWIATGHAWKTLKQWGDFPVSNLINMPTFQSMLAFPFFILRAFIVPVKPVAIQEMDNLLQELAGAVHSFSLRLAPAWSTSSQ